jgi:hypothetical protein
MSLETAEERQQERHPRPASAAARDASFDLAMPDTRALYNLAPDSSIKREPAGTRPAGTGAATARRFVACALAALVGGVAVAAIIALKTAIYLARFNYH